MIFKKYLNCTKIVFLLVAFLACKKQNIVIPKPPDQNKTYTYPGVIGACDNSSILSKDNNIVLCGNFESKILLIKTTKSGKKIWRKEIEAGNGSSVRSLSEHIDGSLFICGSTSRNAATQKKDILILKCNSAGDTIWSKTYGSSENDYGQSIIATSDGNLLISGKTEGFNAGATLDVCLVKINPQGDTIWTKSFEDTCDVSIPDLIETQNGDYLITGSSKNNNLSEVYFLKIDANGTVLWKKTIGPPEFRMGYASIEISDGSILTCGVNAIKGQLIVIKIDQAGNLIWEKEYGEISPADKGVSLKQNVDQTITICGATHDQYFNATGLLMVEIDTDGNQIYISGFASQYSECEGVNIVKNVDDTNIITGNLDGEIFIRKYSN